MRMQKHKRLFLYIGVTIGTVLFILFTSPNNVPAILLVVPFIAFFFLLHALLTLFEKELLRLSAKDKAAKGRLLLFPAISATALTLLLVLGSLGELTLRDVILVIVFGSLIIFYISKTRSRPGRND